MMDDRERAEIRWYLDECEQEKQLERYHAAAIGKYPVTEKEHEHDLWYEDAKSMTLDRLPAFIHHLTEDYIYDYATCVHMIASAAIATANALERSPAARGGITGFQASILAWKFFEAFMHLDKDKKYRLVEDEDATP